MRSLLAVVCSLLLAAVSFEPATVALADASAQGQAAPEVGLTDMSGRVWRMSALRGKVVIVNLWGSWCRPCREEMPFLNTLYERYRGRGLVVLGVAEDTERSAVERALHSRPVSYPIVIDSNHQVAQRYDQVSGTHEIPRSFLIDAQGVVRYVHASRRATDLPRLEAHVVRWLDAARPQRSAQ